MLFELELVHGLLQRPNTEYAKFDANFRDAMNVASALLLGHGF